MIQNFYNVVVLALAVLLVGNGTADAKEIPTNEKPMYGLVHQMKPKNDAERKFLKSIKEADQKFIDAVLAMGYTRKSAAKKSVKDGWRYFRKGDYSLSIKRFNQAWLLDPENGDADYGFALITSVRKGDQKDVEKFFQVALSKPDISIAAHVDYGRFLWSQNRLDESITQLKKTLEIYPKAYNARYHLSHAHYLKRDYIEACRWAELAEKLGEKLPPGYVKDMCQQ